MGGRVDLSSALREIQRLGHQDIRSKDRPLHALKLRDTETPGKEDVKKFVSSGSTGDAGLTVYLREKGHFDTGANVTQIPNNSIPIWRSSLSYPMGQRYIHV